MVKMMMAFMTVLVIYMAEGVYLQKQKPGAVNGWGYCWKCGCNRYEQPFGGGNICRNCGHSYSDHYNVDRP